MKYLNRPALTPQQEQEIFPLLDAALKLPFGKAVAHMCSEPRAGYLARIMNGERYRNAMQSIATYLPSEPFYGKGMYYHLVIEPRPKGVIIAHVKNPPVTLTWKFIECVASKQSIDVSEYTLGNVQSRLKKMKEKFPEEINPIYIEVIEETEKTIIELRYSIPQYEDLVIVDIDTGDDNIRVPSVRDRTKRTKRAKQDE